LPKGPANLAASQTNGRLKIDHERELALSSGTLKERIAGLNQELGRTVRFYRRRGRSANWLSLFLVVAGLLASILIAIGGILFDVSSRFLGALALIPSAALLINSVIQPQARSNWNHAKKDRLNALRRELLYELSDPPNPEEIKSISRKWSQIDSGMDVAWHQTIAIDWSALTHSRLSEDSGVGTQRQRSRQIQARDEAASHRK
jgi:hypothetical protein